ncbi:hypothetical protein NIES73_25440 [Sphaerospermopsis kisseleviana NIES-73]|nr:hypothetical protein NIES73_25440 [Sphaerospermopsis kisseleviana NIES-73]
MYKTATINLVIKYHKNDIAFTKLVRYKVFYLQELGIGNWELGIGNSK